ncbi:tagatose 1,6-diphosphate aldolase [Streptococcus caviae]|uniref:tagatose 1,6-diphosphate aldolase n=1 Tax=Streptococcus sp. 'caviae' TaxID=1915004 RepID=UPI00094B994D|nr:tagatose 1,6-diphosphate aldolase [Streptococcus sp. 'caviae']OLN82836.1 tagatose-bisphosphate aldolase [Streptococcus sp. 'caviae']
MMNHLEKLTTPSGVISALAIDQRGALRRMLGKDTSQKELENFKILVSENLTPYASSILLDPEFGLPAATKRDSKCGLLMAYEKTGYDAETPGRLPDLIDNESVKRLKEKGADAIKLLVYVDIDEAASINDQKKAFVERVGSECAAEGLPLFLEIVSYDANISDKREYAKIKPHKVIEAMKAYADPRFNVAVLKVEVPVDMNFVEGFGADAVYSRKEAAAFYRQQAEATNLPFIFLSAGVSAQMFRDTLRFAKESGSTFNGVLCGRATWAGAAKIYKEAGSDKAADWLQTIGRSNITELGKLVEDLATPIN